MRTLNVDLGARSYPIYIGTGLVDSAQLLRQHIAGRQLIVVSNDTVAPLYLQRVREALDEGLQVSEVVLPDGESFKTLDTLQVIFDRALEDGHRRSTTLLALGGGVVGDMTGFAAACYQRGVDFLQLPTTLLAQVDSSVGGKTGVNHPLGKNMIGAFHQPRAVFIDTAVLATLPAREYAAGLAEVIKYGLICDREFYHWLQDRGPALKARDSEVLAEAIERSCAVKAQVVAADEREGGRRAVLNLGHTFGHAIESAQGYGRWLHGEAVAVGIVLAARLSQARGWLPAAAVAELERWLDYQDLPTQPPGDMRVEDWLGHMARDKKAQDGGPRLILLRDIGSAAVVDDISSETLRTFLEPFSAS